MPDTTSATGTTAEIQRAGSPTTSDSVVPAVLLASRGRWRELLAAVEAAGAASGEYLRQADESGYTALHRLVQAGSIEQFREKYPWESVAAKGLTADAAARCARAQGVRLRGSGGGAAGGGCGAGGGGAADQGRVDSPAQRSGAGERRDLQAMEEGGGEGAPRYAGVRGNEPEVCTETGQITTRYRTGRKCFHGAAGAAAAFSGRDSAVRRMPGGTGPAAAGGGQHGVAADSGAGM